MAIQIKLLLFFVMILLSLSVFYLFIPYLQMDEPISTIAINSTLFYPYIGVIIEFRSTPLLFTIIENVLGHIPSHWPIQIFHGRENSRFIRQSELSKYIKTNRIILHRIDSMKGDPMDFTTRLLTNSSFWRLVRGEKILFFQLDSVFCSKSPHKLEDYLQYDYVGAPWSPSLGIPVPVGNGGFSLRSRNKTLALLNIRSYNHQFHEDVWFSRHLHLVNGTIPSPEIAKTFSVESVFYEKPMAVHKANFLGKEGLLKLCQTCPELKWITPVCRRRIRIG